MTPSELLERLLAAYGPQGWWPGNDPFEIAVGAILVQRTRWRNAARAIENLRVAGCLELDALMQIEETRLNELLKPCGFFRVKAVRLANFCRWLAVRGGFEGLRETPTGALRSALLSVHGIGPETADAILLYACERPVFVVDAYAHRLFCRLGVIDPRTRFEALRRHVQEALDGQAADSFNELHALVVRHGQSVCLTVPACARCVLAEVCKYVL